MKSCPSCLTQYTDDTLLYCLQDGTPLVDSSQSTMQTAAFGETETLVNPRPDDAPADTVKDIPFSNVLNSPGLPAKKKGSRTLVIVAATAIVMLVIFGALGIGSFLFYKNRGIATKNNSRADNVSDKNAGRAEASPSVTTRGANSPTPVNSPSPVPSARPAVNSEVRDEIVSEMDSWLELTEGMDLDSLMDHYAPRVDYYNRRAADVDLIRNDKNRAFSRFDDIEMKFSDLNITQNTSGDKVTAVFDKTWRFRGERTSTGKVRQLLEFERMNGRWLITTERDIKVY